MRGYRLCCAALVLAGLVASWLGMPGSIERGIAAATVNFFSSFTILANCLVFAAFAGPALAPGSRVAAITDRPGVRGAAALYIAVVGLVYVAVLQAVWTPQGLQRLGDILLHYVSPALYLADWLLLLPHGDLRWRHALAWLAFPALYGVYTLAHGALSGFYPYPFVDAVALGVPKVAANMGVLLGLLLVLSAVMLVLDVWLGRLFAGKEPRLFPGGSSRGILAANESDTGGRDANDRGG